MARWMFLRSRVLACYIDRHRSLEEFIYQRPAAMASTTILIPLGSPAALESAKTGRKDVLDGELRRSPEPADKRFRPKSPAHSVELER
jgi:hypothetical protein